MAELRSNAEWRRWGKDDPLWGVASWSDKQKDGASPWTEEEFYGVGDSDWQDFLRQWQQYGVSTSSCLEIGCGAGRITRPLAAAFNRVSAVDVSTDMIARARSAVANGNVDFSIVDGLHLPQADGSISAIFSTHVLQHLDSEEIGLSCFREYYRVLEPGGTLMVHLPLYQFPHDTDFFGALMRSQLAAYRFLFGMKALLYRRLGLKIMRGTKYSIGSLHPFLSELGFKRIEFRIFALNSNRSLHPFVFATK
jgi:SAM-dependent methyltransferase